MLVWSEEATVAFKALKRVMVLVLLLALPRFTLHFVIKTNASKFELGTVSL